MENYTWEIATVETCPACGYSIKPGDFLLDGVCVECAGDNDTDINNIIIPDWYADDLPRPQFDLLFCRNLGEVPDGHGWFYVATEKGNLTKVWFTDGKAEWEEILVNEIPTRYLGLKF